MPMIIAAVILVLFFVGYGIYGAIREQEKAAEITAKEDAKQEQERKAREEAEECRAKERNRFMICLQNHFAEIHPDWDEQKISSMTNWFMEHQVSTQIFGPEDITNKTISDALVEYDKLTKSMEFLLPKIQAANISLDNDPYFQFYDYLPLTPINEDSAKKAVSNYIERQKRQEQKHQLEERISKIFTTQILSKQPTGGKNIYYQIQNSLCYALTEAFSLEVVLQMSDAEIEDNLQEIVEYAQIDIKNWQERFILSHKYGQEKHKEFITDYLLNEPDPKKITTSQSIVFQQFRADIAKQLLSKDALTLYIDKEYEWVKQELEYNDSKFYSSIFQMFISTILLPSRDNECAGIYDNVYSLFDFCYFCHFVLYLKVCLEKSEHIIKEFASCYKSIMFLYFNAKFDIDFEMLKNLVNSRFAKYDEIVTENSKQEATALCNQCIFFLKNDMFGDPLNCTNIECSLVTEKALTEQVSDFLKDCIQSCWPLLETLTDVDA